jgi:hypothetical protein
LGQLRFNRTVYVPVNVVAPDQLHDPVGPEHRENVGLCTRQAKRHAVGSHELVNLGQLRRTLGVDEVHTLQIEHERTGWRVVGEGAHAILERLGRGEEQTAIEAQNGNAGEGLVGGVLV